MVGTDTYGGSVRRYVSVVADSGRWQGFEHRDGDIVISTPPKSGTTWTQMLTALLIFGPEFPTTLNRLSPWFDMDNVTRDEVTEQLAAQAHRRFIKTHAPLDGIPLDERVTYVVVGRDPRDVFLSMLQHVENLNFPVLYPRLIANIGEAEVERRKAAGGPPPASFAEAIDRPVGDAHTGSHPAQVAHHLWGAWQLRNEPNLVLLHYTDMKADCAAELDRLAAALGYDVSADVCGALAAHAGFTQMKARAAELAPEANHENWKSTDDFFREGRLGAWADAFDADTLAHYAERMDALFPDDPDFLEWLHGGRRGGEWRTAEPA